MTKQHDFKRALRDLRSLNKGEVSDEDFLNNNWGLLKLALRIADRLTDRGKITNSVTMVCQDRIHTQHEKREALLAMTQQLIAECNGECGDG